MIWKISCFVFLVFECYSQPITFSKTIDYRGGLEFPISILERDSGYVILGMGHNTLTTGGKRGNVFIKTNSEGDSTYTNFYGESTAIFYAGWIGSFIDVSTSGYAAGVSEFETDEESYQALLIRYNESGDTSFVRRYGEPADDEKANQVIETEDNGFILVGQKHRTGDDIYVVKTDSLGNLEWQKTYLHSINSRGLGIVRAHDGGYVISGWGYSQSFDTDTYIIKIDSVGSEQWRKRFGTVNSDGGAYIVPSSDSTYIVFGEIDTFGLQTINGQELKSIYVMKIDLSGNIIWRYISNFNWYQQAGMVREVAPGNGYILAGQTYDDVFGESNAYGWILRFDNDGNILWERKYAYPNLLKPNGFAYSALYDVRPSRDSGFIFLGVSDELNADLWLLKVDGFGCMGHYCGLTDTNCYYQPWPCPDDTVGIEDIASLNNKEVNMQVYPNPADETLYISLFNVRYELISVTITDVSGKEVLQTMQTTIPVSLLSSGLYFVRVKWGNGESAVRKIIVQ